jgi:hypothetical protein
MARTLTISLSPREQAALAMWFLDVVSPKTRHERRAMQTAIDELQLDDKLDEMAGPRPALRTLDRAHAARLQVSDTTIRYVRAEIDPEKRPGITGHIHSVLGPLDDRLAALLEAPPEAPAQDA